MVRQANEREALLVALDDAAHGLRLSEMGAIPVPTQFVSSTDHFLWVSRPGRYSVSRKCDGMRCLLFRDQTGAASEKSNAIFMNRAGTMYRLPIPEHVARLLPFGECHYVTFTLLETAMPNVNEDTNL